MRTYYSTRQSVPPFDPGGRSGAHGGVLAGLRADGDAPFLFRFVNGIDAAPKPMARAEVEALGDAFTREILLEGRAPLTLRSLAGAIGALAAPARPLRRMFLVAEGGQARSAEPQFGLNARLVFTWQSSAAAPPDLMLSTVPAADDRTALLQLIAWSEAGGAFHYFERKSGAWVWAGDSFHALSAPSRGKGPFDSHVNGSLVMKELKAPWAHWHSMNNSIPAEAFEPGSEFLTDPLYRPLSGAQDLEPIVRKGIRRWTRSRFERQRQGGRLTRLKDYFRQILRCSSINLVSAPQRFAGPDVTGFVLPGSFFFDKDALEFLGGELDPGVDLIPARHIEIEAGRYRAAVAAAGIGLTDDDGTRVAGDTHFAFLVPERAAEDQAVLEQLVAGGALSARLALCLVMTDFPNPLFSPERAALMAYVPDEIAIGEGGAALDLHFIAAVRAAGRPAPSPEAELLALWDHPDLAGHAAALLAAYAAAVSARLGSQAGVEALLGLAESRRDVVRRTRSLAEFPSTLAGGPAPVPHLAMRPDGSIFAKTTDLGEDEL